MNHEAGFKINLTGGDSAPWDEKLWDIFMEFAAKLQDLNQDWTRGVITLPSVAQEYYVHVVAQLYEDFSDY